VYMADDGRVCYDTRVTALMRIVVVDCVLARELPHWW
jgi:hypothetical protein